MMIKNLGKITGSLVLLSLTNTLAFGFNVQKPLADQAALLNSTAIDSSDHLMLEKTMNSSINDVAVSPDYQNDRSIMISTGAGLFQNFSYDPQFSQNAGWPDAVKQGPMSISYSANYKDSGALVLHNGSNNYLSYDRGSTWSVLNLDSKETVQSVATGPGYNVHSLLYFITPSGLYRQDPSSNTASQVLASDSSGTVTLFNRAESSSSDSIFYVVKGSKILKTENFGSSWLENDTGGTVKKLLITNNNTDSGEVMALVGKKTILKSESSFTFYPMNIPSSVNEIYDMAEIINGDHDYAINTDDGIYLTYSNGDTWSKVPYDITDYSAVSHLNAIQENADTELFYVVDNILYRDGKADGHPAAYMNGITVTTRYATSGSAQSKEMVALSGQTFDPTYNVNQATLWADAALNSQSMNFFMTVDGTNWEAVTPNEQHTFTNKGNMLKWKVEMSTTDAAVTPVLNSVSVDFGFETPPVTPSTQCAGFSDVLATDPNCAAITYAKDQGIFEGYQDGSFKPDQAISRSETVKVITVGFNKTILPAPSDNLGFSDVVLSDFYMPYLATAKADGIVQGYPDGTFKPAQTVNYVELIKVFFKTSGVTLPTAVATDPWYQPYLTYAKNNNYLVYGNLDAGMKRADVATLFYQYSQK